MTNPAPVHASERLIIRRGTSFAELSVDTYEPEQPRATIFCLHDYLGNSQDFRQLGAFLAAHQYRVICPDMFGRGDSAYLSDPTLYKSGTFLFSMMAVMQRFADRRIIIIAKGWGALLALMLCSKMTFELERLIVADVPLVSSVDWDQLPPTNQLDFATLDEARQSVLASTELAEMPEPAASAMAEGRVRQTEAGRFALRFDPVLIKRLERLRGLSVNTARLIAGVKASVLHLSGDRLPDEDRKTLRAVMDPRSALADGLAPGGRVHFSSAHQQLLVLGFLESRQLAGD
jgi:pimeloyl-ACP methyl ester carboxylesterase